MRIRNLLKENSPKIPSDAYAYYPFNGDTLDYSGNGRDIVSTNKVTVNSDHVLPYDTYSYLKTPIQIVNGMTDTTTSVSFYWDGVLYIDTRKNRALFGITTLLTSDWVRNSFVIQINSSSNGNIYISGYINDGWAVAIPQLSIGVHNITITKSSNTFKCYLDGELYNTLLFTGNLAVNSSQTLHIGNRSNNGNGFDQGFRGPIYGFVHYKRVLSDDEIKALAESL